MFHNITIHIQNPQQHTKDYVETTEHYATKPLLMNTALAQQDLECITAKGVLKCQPHIPVTTLYQFSQIQM